MSGADRVVVLAPTMLEWLAAKLVIREAPVHYSGVGMKRLSEVPPANLAITCGLAGGLDHATKPGTIFIPSEVVDSDGFCLTCDPPMIEASLTASRKLGYETCSGQMLTADKIITGQERAKWAEKGLTAVDMETALIRGVERVASVRVILDNPEFSIAEEWTRASRAFLRPRLWRELLWLAWSAPRYSFRAARVLRTALTALNARAG